MWARKSFAVSAIESSAAKPRCRRAPGPSAHGVAVSRHRSRAPWGCSGYHHGLSRHHPALQPRHTVPHWVGRGGRGGRGPRRVGLRRRAAHLRIHRSRGHLHPLLPRRRTLDQESRRLGHQRHVGRCAALGRKGARRFMGNQRGRPGPSLSRRRRSHGSGGARVTGAHGPAPEAPAHGALRHHGCVSGRCIAPRRPCSFLGSKFIRPR